MKIIDVELVIPGTPEALWAVWTDVDAWTEWDPHQEQARLIDTFSPGGRGYTKPAGAPGGEFTLLRVEAPHLWVSQSRLPGGRLTFEHTIAAVDEQSSRVHLVGTSQGPMGIVVQLGWGRGMRADARQTLAALGRRAAELHRP